MTDTRRSNWRTLAEDVFLGVAALALVVALAWPRAGRELLARRAFAVEADVETVQTAAGSFWAERHAWPVAADPGVVPPDLAGHLPDGFSFRGAGYVIEWERWETVEAPPPEAAPKAPEVLLDSPLFLPSDSVPPVRPEVGEIGGVTVRARDTRLLAALLGHFGPQRSFVWDETWTLVLPREGR